MQATQPLRTIGSPSWHGRARATRRFPRLAAPVLLAGFAAACDESPTDRADAAQTPLRVQVQKPPPGVDIDRRFAPGRVVDAQGRLGWYPHEGGLLRYRVNIRFGLEPHTMPEGWHFGRVSAVATDSANRVFVFQRGAVADPIIVFDSEGKYLRSFGREFDFANEHGLRIDRYDNVWVTDNRGHTVRKFRNDGELLLTLGIEDQAGTTEETFDRPADIAFGPNDEVYVADGYGNSRVVKFDPDGDFLRTWGSPGSGPGEFNLVHSLATDSRGNVYVSDRENSRIQIFDSEGNLLRIWTHLGSTQGIFITPDDAMWIITHRDNIEGVTYGSLAGRIMRVDIDTGEILGAMESPGHWIDVSDAGEIYIASLTGSVFKWYQGWLP